MSLHRWAMIFSSRSRVRRARQTDGVIRSSAPLPAGITRWRPPLWSLPIAVIAGVTLTTAAARAIGPKDRRVTNARSGISVEAPAGWSLSQHTGYADTVVSMVHPDGSRISVSAASTSLRDADELYQQNRPGLVAQGLTPTIVGAATRGSLAIDLTATGRADRLRQLYLVREVPLGRQAIVLTLVSGAKSFLSRLPALEQVASRLTLDDPLPTATVNRGSAAAGGAGGSAVSPVAPP